jgi:uncharacterized damage-inducible protein DinB
MADRVPPPQSNEYGQFHEGYVAAVSPGGDGLELLVRQQEAIEAMHALSDEQAAHRYAPGKWSVREIVGHLSDAERIFAARILRFGRGDATPLPGFDEGAFAAASNADRRPIGDLVDELRVVRASTIALVRGLDEAVLGNRGTVNTWSLSVRALVFITAGHFAHHITVLRDRYDIHL